MPWNWRATRRRDVLFHHVMRSYYFGERRAAAEFASYDREVVLLSLVLHDLGLTDRARGPRRFEIEGADVAREFATTHGLAREKAWLVWDNIALHPLDLNLYKQPEARAVEWGICADVLGSELEALGRDAVAEIVAAFPGSASSASCCGCCARKRKQSRQRTCSIPARWLRITASAACQFRMRGR